MRLLKPQEAAALQREALEAHIVALLRRCPGLLALRGAHAHLLRLRLPRLTAAFALSKLLAACASARAASTRDDWPVRTMAITKLFWDESFVLE